MVKLATFCPTGSIIYYLDRLYESYNYSYISFYCVSLFSGQLVCINQQMCDEFGLETDDYSKHKDIIVDKGGIEDLLKRVTDALGHEIVFKEL